MALLKLVVSERKNKGGYLCPDCESEHIVRFGKYSIIVDEKLVPRVFSTSRTSTITTECSKDGYNDLTELQPSI